MFSAQYIPFWAKGFRRYDGFNAMTKLFAVWKAANQITKTFVHVRLKCKAKITLCLLINIVTSGIIFQQSPSFVTGFGLYEYVGGNFRTIVKLVLVG